MGKIDTSEWKEFRVGDLFDIHPTKAYKCTNAELLDGGGTNVVVNSAYDNGIGGTSTFSPTENGNMITFSDTVDANTIFYQESPFVGYPHVQGLYPVGKYQNAWTRGSLQYFVTVFRERALAVGFDYGNKFRRDIAANLFVRLPATPDGAPDWAYMESYMANLETKVAESLTLLQAAKDAEKKKVDTREWGEFRVGELFDAALSKDDIQPKVIVEGNTPLVSSGKENNGIIAFIDNKNARLWEANTLTVDMFGKVFYQEQPYYAVSHGRVNILMPRMPMTKHCMQFIGCAIERVTTDKYAFSEMCTGTKLLKDVIMLPKDKAGQPDWAYMEEYMRKMEEKVENVLNCFKEDKDDV